MAKKASQAAAAVSAKSIAPAPAKPTKAPPIVPQQPGKGEKGGSDPTERAKKVSADELLSRYFECQQDPEMTWQKFADKYGMNKGTCQVGIQNAKNRLKEYLRGQGLSDEEIELKVDEAIPPFQSREGGMRESSGKALNMLLGRLSGWNAGSK